MGTVSSCHSVNIVTSFVLSYSNQQDASCRGPPPRRISRLCPHKCPKLPLHRVLLRQRKMHPAGFHQRRRQRLWRYERRRKLLPLPTRPHRFPRHVDRTQPPQHVLGGDLFSPQGCFLQGQGEQDEALQPPIEGKSSFPLGKSHSI